MAASIFVNPTQFAAHEDLDTYPRQLEADLALLESLGTEIAFAPSVEVLYPRGAADCFVVSPPPRFAELAEARMRPAHFAGVATVCLKLFNIVRPTIAFFGQKDALQCVVLRQLVADLNLRLALAVVPTAREPDGLALSSRNAYLDLRQRAAAPVVYSALCAARDRWLATTQPTPAAALAAATRAVLAREPLIEAVEYLSVADYDDMTELECVPPPDGSPSPKALVSLALRIGRVRLIDNLPLVEET